MPPDLAILLPDAAAIDRAATSLDARMDWKKIPAKPAVYLLTGCDESAAPSQPDAPLLLATVGDLRAALKRRLDDPDHPELHAPATDAPASNGPENAAPESPAPATDGPPEAAPAPHPTRRIPYHRLCTRVQFQIVHSPFAANHLYLQAARLLHPDTYHELLSFGPTWWITVNPADPFPRLRPTQSISHANALYAGPIRDRSAAARLIDSLEDLFDLCREYPTLQLAPSGRPCAYKEMGKCPAPCDGSVPMSWYHTQIAAAWDFLTDKAARHRWLRDQETLMREAAGRLEFERAAKIKNRIARGQFLDARNADPYAHLAPLQHFSTLALQPGRGKRFLNPFLIHGGTITALPEIAKKDISTAAPQLLETLHHLTATAIVPPFNTSQVDNASLLAYHLFRNDPGTYLRTHTLLTAGPQSLQSTLEQFLASPPPLKSPAATAAAETLDPRLALASPLRRAAPTADGQNADPANTASAHAAGSTRQSTHRS